VIQEQRQDVGATPATSGVSTRQGADLPHWNREGGIYAVTFRLAGSLPKPVLEAWLSERKAIVDEARRQNRQLSDEELERLNQLHSEKVEMYLDAGHGACLMNRPDAAEIVQNALKHFSSKRYKLLAWCIMPNHVHVVLQPSSGHALPDILHSWKSFSASKINALVQRKGELWQADYFDHLVRDERDLAHCVDYAWRNAERAGLADWRWCGRWDETNRTFALPHELPQLENHALEARATLPPKSGTGSQPVVQRHGQDARATAAFAYIKSRLGIDKCNTLLLGSPFDYEKQATLYIETGLPEPSDPLFLGRACEKIIQYLLQTNGGAFVLFTSYSMLKEVAQRLRPQLEQVGLPVLVQGEGPPPRVLLERFRATPNAVLFGTSSFWQGIDVQGDQLRNVIIVKLPFAVPDEPVIEARLDAIKRGGGNPFMEYSVPEAIIRLKQGFGRLIRSKSDKGIVVILDSRVVTKRYGRLFVDALPGCRRVEVK
jgi:REP element-mobilizing transposase RayT